MKTYKILPALTDTQMEIVNGSLLGDASLWHVKKTNCNWKFTKGQSIYDKNGNDKISYIQWHFDMLLPYSGKLSIKTTYKMIVNTSDGMMNVDSEVPYRSYCFTTHCHPAWTELAKKWYLWKENKPILKNNRIIKIVPSDLKLTPLTLCVWFMDDGFLYPKNGNAVLCTHGFTIEECEFLVEKLRNDLEIHSKVRLDSRNKQPFIFIGVKSFHDLINLIKPYVQWDCFKYKLDDSYDKIHQSGENHSQAKLTEEQVKKMIAMRKEGKTVEQIAESFDISEANVSLITSGSRWKHLNDGIEVIRKPRVTQGQKQQVLRLLGEGLSQKEIARSLNINQSTVSRILCKNCIYASP